MNRVQKREIAQRYSKTPALEILYEMFHEINRRYYGYRRSWEMLIEVLAHHLGIINNPWLYSKPDMDIEQRIDKLNPLRRSAFQIEWPKYDPLAMLLGIPPPKNFQPKIKHPEPTHPHHVIYYDHRYRLHWRQHVVPKGEVRKLLCQFTEEGLLEQYVTVARKDPWDHLGEIYIEQMLGGRHHGGLGQCLTPKAIVDFMIKMVGIVSDKAVTRPQTVIDPAGSGTGRFLIEASNMAPEKPLILFGIEIDVTLYRASLVNMALFSHHPYSIICADALMIDAIYTTTDSPIWNLGNLWSPPDMSRFYWKPPPPPQPFSLKAFVEMQQQAEAKQT
jgi:hypothetical protein